jgi:hypothetical protein
MKHYGKHNRPDEGPKPKDYTPRERDAKNKAGWIDDRPDWITGFGMKDNEARAEIKANPMEVQHTVTFK